MHSNFHSKMDKFKLVFSLINKNNFIKKLKIYITKMNKIKAIYCKTKTQKMDIIYHLRFLLKIQGQALIKKI